MIDLTTIPTCALLTELALREGVKELIADPGDSYSVDIGPAYETRIGPSSDPRCRGNCGPARILIITEEE